DASLTEAHALPFHQNSVAPGVRLWSATVTLLAVLRLPLLTLTSKYTPEVVNPVPGEDANCTTVRVPSKPLPWAVICVDDWPVAEAVAEPPLLTATLCPPTREFAELVKNSSLLTKLRL